MSYNSVIRRYEHKLDDAEEDWKQKDEAVKRVWFLEETVSELKNILQSLIKWDRDLFQASLEAGSNESFFKEWQAKFDALFVRVKDQLVKWIAYADEIDYYSYKEGVFSREQLNALLRKSGWLTDPESHLIKKLRPRDRVEGDFSGGRCGDFPPEA